MFGYKDYPPNLQKECTEGISLLTAAECLYYRFNSQEWVKYIWAVGLLAAGQSSTMTVSGSIRQVLLIQSLPCALLNVCSSSLHFFLPRKCTRALIFVVCSRGREGLQYLTRKGTAVVVWSRHYDWPNPMFIVTCIISVGAYSSSPQ